MMEQSDGELLVACRNGDQRAWESLVNRYQRLVYTIPRRSGLNEDLAAEVFQEVFTTLLEKLNDIQQPDRIKAWIVTTARRKTWHIITREDAHRSVDDLNDQDQSEFERLADDAALPDEVLIQLEEQHQVRTAVAALDDRCRQLLTRLFYTAEAKPSYAKIAAELGTTEGSIGPTRARCLQKLLRLLERSSPN